MSLTGLTRALAERVELVVDPEIDRRFPDRWSCVVEVQARGQRFSEAVDAARGDPKRPLTADELREKLMGLASLALPATRIAELHAALAALPDQHDLNAIAAVLPALQPAPHHLSRKDPAGSPARASCRPSYSV
jgi:2-methylcitrate dehydratase PrpD